MASSRAYNVERKNNYFRYTKFGYKRMGDHAAHDIGFFLPPPKSHKN